MGWTKLRSTLVGYVAVYCAAGLALAGCSGDDSTGNPPEEAGVDAYSHADVGVDAPHVDAADAARSDAAVDASKDGASEAAQEDASDAAKTPDVVTSDAHDAGVADASDASTPDAHDSAAPDANDASTPDAHDSAAPDANDATTVDAHDSATPDANDATTVDAHDSATPDANDAEIADSTVDATDSPIIIITGDSGEDAADSTTPPGDSGESDASDASDAVSDSSPGDAADAADADAMTYPPGLLDYPDAYAHAYCEGTEGCCAGVDMDACVAGNGVSTGGWEGTMLGNPQALVAGHLTFNQEAGARCVAALTSFPCASANGVISAAAYGGITTACREVFGGTIVIDAGGCVSSFECVEGAYCNTDAGMCSPLVGDGGSCTSDEMCSSVATGNPALFCDNVFSPLADGGLGSGTCVPLQLDGGTCSDDAGDPYNEYCSSLLCGTSDFVTYSCGSELDFGTSCP